MRKLSAISAAVVVLGASAVPPEADAMVITQNISLGTLLSTGQSQDVQFNIGSLLANQGFTPGDVVSANLIVYGLSDAQYGAAAPQPYSDYQYSGNAGGHLGAYYYTYTYLAGYTSYSCGFWGTSTCYTPYYATANGVGYYYIQDYEYTRVRDILYKDSVADTMQVTAGASANADVADQVSSFSGSYGSRNFEYVDYGYFGSSYSYYYNRQRDVYEAIAGPLEVAMALDATALSDLSGDGIFDIRIGASTGQFRTQMASLSLNVEQFIPNGSVPEPGTLALAGVALAAMAGRRRIKK